jgi:hypothetical protein
LILAVTMVALLQAFSSGLRGLDAAQASSTAVLHARSKLDEIGAIIPLEPGSFDGDLDDGFHWRVEIRPFETADGVEDSAPTVVPYEVEVQVSWDGGGPVTLQSLRLAPRQ